MTAEPVSNTRSVTDLESMQLLDRDGTSLAFHEVGAGDPAFVFVHGWTCNHNDFGPQVDYFGRHPSRSKVRTVPSRVPS